MTQINIKRLDSLTHNDTAATKLINDNFQAIEKALEDSLSRKKDSVNYMDTELDMNTKRIINIADPVEAGDVVNKKYFDDNVGNAKASADAAKAAADRAESHAKNAQVANVNAQNVAQEMRDGIEVAKEVKDLIQFRPYIVTFQPIPDKWETISEEAAEIQTGSKEFKEVCTVLDLNTTVPYRYNDYWTADVTLASDLALSGNFAPICTVDADNNKGYFRIVIKIYAKTKYVSDTKIEKSMFDLRNITVYYSRGV